jgi:hypothetical protein
MRIEIEDLPIERRPVTDPAEAKRAALQSFRQQQVRERRRKPKVRSAKPAKLTPSAEAYAKAEERWQAELKRRAKAPAPTARSKKGPRHQFTPAERDEMIRRGVTMVDGSYAIRTADELRKTIRVASERGSGRDSLRRHCIRRAAVFGLSEAIPENWRGDGGLKETLADSAASIEGVEDEPRYDRAQINELGRQGKAFRKRDGSFGWPCADRRDLMDCLEEWTPDVPEAAAVKAFLIRRAVVMRLQEELPKSWGRTTPRPGPNEPQ